jgi:predicted nucleotidyltransferase
MDRSVEQILNFLATEVTARYGERLVALAVFGSCARDTMRPDSDIDLLIVAKELPNGRMRRVSEFEPVEGKLLPSLRAMAGMGRYTTLSPIFKTPEEVAQGSPLFLDMTESVRILFEKENFLSSYLAGLKKRLLAQGARRVPFKGGYYWELKPDYREGDVIHL